MVKSSSRIVAQGRVEMSDLRQLLHRLADTVADHLEPRPHGARYYDQDSSPLPPATYRKLVRCGVLPGFKRHGRILVEREVLHRYIEAGRVAPVVAAEVDEDRAVEQALEQLKRVG
jgi:hypothetical protein